jgi:transcriptional regulator with XRE-family HTH domain
MPEIKANFMEWLDGETARRGRQDAVAALLQEMRVESQLAELRRKRGITQAELAKRMGVKQPLIARLEAGRAKNLTLTTIMKAAMVLGADVELRIKPRRVRAPGGRGRTWKLKRSEKRLSRRTQDVK